MEDDVYTDYSSVINYRMENDELPAEDGLGGHSSLLAHQCHGDVLRL